MFVISHDDRYFDVADRIIKLADGQLETVEQEALAVGLAVIKQRVLW